MPNILALFALFSIGSAAAIGCAAAEGYCTNNADVIGYCTTASGPCVVDSDKVCQGKAAGTVCGEGLLQGNCDDSTTKQCIFNKKIKVDYTLQVTTGDTGIKNFVASNKFKTNLTTAFNRNIGDVYPACTPARAALPHVKRLVCPVAHAFFGAKCSLECDDGYAVKKEHGTTCGASGAWVLDDGACVEACSKTIVDSSSASSPVVGVGATSITGALVAGTLDSVEFTIASNVLSCNIFTGADCGLECSGSNQVSTGTTIKCAKDSSDSKYRWTGTLGVCAASSDSTSATVAVVLNGNDDHAKITANGASTEKTAFLQEFKQKIAQAIPGISVANVDVVGVRLVAAGGRRLNAGDAGERSVLVDYTILGSPKGAAELVPPRVLRGIP